MKKIKFKKSDVTLGCLFLAVVLINMIARLSTAFSDAYVSKVYPIISTPFVFLSGLLPFSLGELEMAIAVAFLILGVPALIVFVCIKRKNKELTVKTVMIAIRIMLWIIFYIALTETLNCFVMYQCTPFSEKYFEPTEHTEELLIETLGAVSEKLETLCPQFTRGEDGYIVLPDESYIEDCKKAMKDVSSDYSQLSGYYPKPKKIVCSFFMSQQSIIGLYIPFAFEATYNRDPQDISKASTICHELAHLKGVIQEDEASFVSFVACTRSDSDILKYSAYLDAFYYLYVNAKDLLDTEYDEKLRKAVACVPDEVWDKDLYSFKASYWEDNKDKEIIPTETVQAVSEALTEANLKFNEVEDGIMVYNRVTELLMDYYASNGSI